MSLTSNTSDFCNFCTSGKNEYFVVVHVLLLLYEYRIDDLKFKVFGWISMVTSIIWNFVILV